MIRSELHGNVLPPLPKLPAKEMAGPTPWSNYVIRHADGHSGPMVLAGAYPASLDDVETERILTTLLEMGINTFVCLQAEVNINTPESAWRKGHGLRPYIKDAQRILSRAHEQGNPRIAQSKIDFLHLPIIDGSVTTDSAMSRLADDCCDRVLKGERLYIHCWGGHGRTGTLVAVMLGRLYSIPYTLALRYTQAFHDSRIYPQGVRSPQTPVQRAQVRDGGDQRGSFCGRSSAGLLAEGPRRHRHAVSFSFTTLPDAAPRDWPTGRWCTGTTPFRLVRPRSDVCPAAPRFQPPFPPGPQNSDDHEPAAHQRPGVGRACGRRQQLAAVVVVHRRQSPEQDGDIRLPARGEWPSVERRGGQQRQPHRLGDGAGFAAARAHAAGRHALRQPQPAARLVSRHGVGVAARQQRRPGAPVGRHGPPFYVITAWQRQPPLHQQRQWPLRQWQRRRGRRLVSCRPVARGASASSAGSGWQQPVIDAEKVRGQCVAVTRTPPPAPTWRPPFFIFLGA